MPTSQTTQIINSKRIFFLTISITVQALLLFEVIYVPSPILFNSLPVEMFFPYQLGLNDAVQHSAISRCNVQS